MSLNEYDPELDAAPPAKTVVLPTVEPIRQVLGNPDPKTNIDKRLQESDAKTSALIEDGRVLAALVNIASGVKQQQAISRESYMAFGQLTGEATALPVNYVTEEPSATGLNKVTAEMDTTINRRLSTVKDNITAISSDLSSLLNTMRTEYQADLVPLYDQLTVAFSFAYNNYWPEILTKSKFLYMAADDNLYRILSEPIATVEINKRSIDEDFVAAFEKLRIFCNQFSVLSAMEKLGKTGSIADILRKEPNVLDVVEYMNQSLADNYLDFYSLEVESAAKELMSIGDVSKRDPQELSAIAIVIRDRIERLKWIRQVLSTYVIAAFQALNAFMRVTIEKVEQ